MVSILNSIRSSIGSKWGCARTGVIWQGFGETVTAGAAAFCTRWNCLIKCLGTPWSSCIKGKIFTRLILRRWYNAYLQIAGAWGTILRDSSKGTPMLLAFGEASTLSSSQTWVCIKGGRARGTDDITKSSVLSLFNFNLFGSIQE